MKKKFDRSAEMKARWAKMTPEEKAKIGKKVAQKRKLSNPDRVSYDSLRDEELIDVVSHGKADLKTVLRMAKELLLQRIRIKSKV